MVWSTPYSPRVVAGTWPSPLLRLLCEPSERSDSTRPFVQTVWLPLSEHRNTVNAMIHLAKCDYFKSKLSDGDSKTCFRVMDSLFKSADRKLPSTSNMNTLCSDFAGFFSGKVDAIRKEIDLQVADGNLVTIDSCAPRSEELVSLDDTTDEELESIKQCNSKTCCLDSTPTGLLKSHVAAHLPCLVSLVNASLQQGSFPRALKTANVIPVLKKGNSGRECAEQLSPGIEHFIH